MKCPAIFDKEYEEFNAFLLSLEIKIHLGQHEDAALESNCFRRLRLAYAAPSLLNRKQFSSQPFIELKNTKLARHCLTLTIANTYSF
ncbi:uncharacterized protein LOC144641825 isoform X2 [Oculina patagonica]